MTRLPARCLLIACSLFAAVSGSTEAADYASLFRKLNPTVVTIQTIELANGSRGVEPRQLLGSGVLFDMDGLVMTASHVVHTADVVRVKFLDGTIETAEVVSSLPGSDVALLKVAHVPAGAVAARLGNSDEVRIGEPALVIGAPFGLEHSLSIGHVSGKVRRGVMAGGVQLQLIQTDAAINHGNSGGPMFNESGEVIGIVSHILSESGGFDGIGFAISINPARQMLLEGTPFWTGFEGLMMSEELAGLLNVPQKSGLLVQRVVQTSLAGRAGLRGGTRKVTLLGTELWLGGDVILEIEKTVCDSPHNFESIHKTIDSLQPGDAINMKVLRAGKVIELRLGL